MRIFLMRKIYLLAGMLLSLHSQSQSLIQGTIKPGPGPNEVEVWLKPNFSNNTQYLFQIGLPVAWPASASPQPTALTVTLDPGFVAAFGNNYSPVTINPIAQNTGGTEKYFNIVLIRGGAGASDPQNWSAGVEFKVLTAAFDPAGSPSAQVKLADYQDGGSDGQGNFYTQSGNSDYYVSSNSVGNFYASAGQSTVGGNALEGYTQTIAIVPSSACIAPSGPTVTNITTTSAAISWNAVGGVAGYEYIISTNATPPSSGTATTGTSYAATGLTAGTAYYAHVRSDCGSGNFSAWVSTGFTTVCPAPAAPTITNITATTADIDWTALSGVAGYEYAITTNAAPPASGTATTGTQYNATGLTPGTPYYAHLRSSCGGSFSAWVTVSFTTATPTCTPPSAPTVSNVSNSTADISWNAVSGVLGYEYEVSTSSTPPASGTATTNTSFSATGLISGTTYYAHVRSDCGGGNFSAWVSSSFSTLCPATSVPVVNNISSGSAAINWTAVSGGVTGYEYALNTNAEPPASGAFTSSTNYNGTGLTAGTPYYFHVRTACSAGNFSAWVTVSFTTDCPETGAPTVSNITPSSAAITWAAVSGVSGYEYAVTTSSTEPASGTATTGTSVNATGLTPGTTYYVYIRSSCSAGIFSEWSSGSFTTSYPPCVAPASLAVTNISSNADINWSAVSGAAGYEYAITTSSAAPASGTAITVNSYQATGLQSSTQYYVHVRTNCGPGGFSPWVSKAFTTPCLAPVLTATVNGNAGVIQWNAVHGVMNFEYALTTYLAAPLSGTSTSDTVHTVSNLLPGTTYYFHVRSQCGAGGISEWATILFHTAGIEVYPNPVRNTITINLYGVSGGNGQLSLYDAAGKLVRKIVLTNNTTTMDMRGLAAGVYMMTYNDGKNKYRVRVVKR